MAQWKIRTEQVLGESISRSEALTSGTWAQAFKLTAARGKYYFLKTSLNASSMFNEEATGLRALSETETVRCPAVLAADDHMLLLEWIQTEDPQERCWTTFAHQLAALHSRPGANFGFSISNHIGATPQENPELAVGEVSWSDYFIEHRLKPMLHHPSLVHDALLQATYTKSEISIRRHLDRVKEKPCLVHGDLWNGNMLCGPDQIPYMIDPAPYYGHREVDLAMSELFGGFSPTFYDAYRARLPLQDAYESRRAIYNLYHLLNHWILFGESYRARTLSAFREIS